MQDEKTPPLTTLSIGIGLIIAVLGLLVITKMFGYRGNAPDSQTVNQATDAARITKTTQSNITSTSTALLASPQEVQPTDQITAKELPSRLDEANAENSTTPPYTAESILAALQQVNLDNQNKFIIDHAAFLALKRSMGHKALTLDTLQLAELQALIEIGLPGEAGQQAAYIAGKYYNYLQAKRDYLDLHRNTDQVKDYPVMQQQLTTLRHIYLGENLTQQLFSRHDAENTYLYERFQLASNTELSLEERQQRMTEINEHLRIGLATSLGLKDKYQHYLQKQKQLVGNQSNIESQQWHDIWSDTFTEIEQQALHSLNIQPYPSHLE